MTACVKGCFEFRSKKREREREREKSFGRTGIDVCGRISDYALAKKSYSHLCFRICTYSRCWQLLQGYLAMDFDVFRIKGAAFLSFFLLDLWPHSPLSGFEGSGERGGEGESFRCEHLHVCLLLLPAALNNVRGRQDTQKLYRILRFVRCGSCRKSFSLSLSIPSLAPTVDGDAMRRRREGERICFPFLPRVLISPHSRI